MCSGVIAITMTMTACDTTSAIRARRARGWAQAIRIACRNPTVWDFLVARSAARGTIPPATTNGSGRIQTKVPKDARANRPTDIAKPPAFSSSEIDAAAEPATPMNRGNSTAPNVLAKITVPMSRPRRSAVDRSAAA